MWCPSDLNLSSTFCRSRTHTHSRANATRQIIYSVYVENYAAIIFYFTIRYFFFVFFYVVRYSFRCAPTNSPLFSGFFSFCLFVFRFMRLFNENLSQYTILERAHTHRRHRCPYSRDTYRRSSRVFSSSQHLMCPISLSEHDCRECSSSLCRWACSHSNWAWELGD